MWLSPLLWQAETKNGTLKKKEEPVWPLPIFKSVSASGYGREIVFVKLFFVAE